MIVLQLLVLTLTSQVAEPPPMLDVRSSMIDDLSVDEVQAPPRLASRLEAMRRVWFVLEREELTNRRARLLDDRPEIPTYSVAQALTSVGAAAALGAAGLWIGVAKTSGWTAGALSFSAVVLSALAIGMLIAGLVRFYRTNLEREEAAETRAEVDQEVREIDGRLRSIDRLAPPDATVGRSPFAVPLGSP